MLIDAKDRHYLITLREGAAFHTHAGIIQHDDVIGAPEGSLIKGNTERSFLVLRPTLADVVLKMPRGAQVIYPKDLGTILMQADIGPGMRVLEAGVGSGALSMTMLRAGAVITGYEIREDFAALIFKAGDRTFSCSFSSGVAGFPDFASLEQIVQAADKALYASKSCGRNRVEAAHAPFKGMRG